MNYNNVMSTLNKKEIIQELLRRGWSQDAISKELEITSSTVSYYVSKYDLGKSIHKLRVLNFKAEELQALSDRGLNSAAMCKELDVSVSALFRHLRKHGIKLPKRRVSTRNQMAEMKGVLGCTICKLEKPPTAFYKSEGIFNSYCKACTNDMRVTKLRDLKQLAVSYKGGKCEKCGYCKSNAALEFHHIDPTQKDFAISAKPKSYLDEEMKQELNKCMILCANCHREIHEELRNNGIEALR